MATVHTLPSASPAPSAGLARHTAQRRIEAADVVVLGAGVAQRQQVLVMWALAHCTPEASIGTMQ